MRGKREDILRRLGGLVMAAALVASQLLGALAPIAAYAASGSMTITSSTHGGEGFIAFGTADGHEAYCINPERSRSARQTATRRTASTPSAATPTTTRSPDGTGPARPPGSCPTRTRWPTS